MRTSAGLLLLFLVNSPGLYAASSVAIPRVDKAPRLQDFEDMKPHGAATELRKISSFTQQSFHQRWPPILREDQLSFPALTAGGFSSGSLIGSLSHLGPALFSWLQPAALKRML
jgi:hypothetical protein